MFNKISSSDLLVSLYKQQIQRRRTHTHQQYLRQSWRITANQTSDQIKSYDCLLHDLKQNNVKQWNANSFVFTTWILFSSSCQYCSMCLYIWPRTITMMSMLLFVIEDNMSKIGYIKIRDIYAEQLGQKRLFQSSFCDKIFCIR